MYITSVERSNETLKASCEILLRQLEGGDTSRQRQQWLVESNETHYQIQHLTITQ